MYVCVCVNLTEILFLRIFFKHKITSENKHLVFSYLQEIYSPKLHNIIQGVLLPDRQTLRSDSRHEDKHY